MNECLDLVCDLLHESTLPDHVTQGIFNLLKITLKQNFFIFGNTLYEQKFGLAMGSPLSPLLAEVFMKHLEHNYIKNSPLFTSHIFTWHRFVDDVFVIFRGSTEQADLYLQHLKSIRINLKFSTEVENEYSLPFLDLKIIRNNVDNKLRFEIFRKPTATYHLIPYDSSHPTQHKIAAFYNLFHRLLSAPLNKENFTKECEYILRLAMVNGFPLKLIQNIFHKVNNKLSLKRLTQLSQTNKEYTYFSVPYIPTLSFRLQRILNKHNIKLTFTTSNTLASIFANSKQFDAWDMSGVYRLTACCGKYYIGRTSRSLKIRSSEHTKLVNPKYLTDLVNLKQRSSFAYHALTCSLCTDPCNIQKQILYISNNYFDNMHLENLEISSALKFEPQQIINESTDFQVIVLDELGPYF